MIRNVLTVCDGAGMTGGTEKVAITSAIELANLGYRSIYFAGEGTPHPGFVDAGVEASSMGLADAYHTQSKRELLSRFFWNRQAEQQFSELLSQAKVEPRETIIHVHGFRRVLSASVVIAAAKAGFRQVFTLHDFGIACPNTSFFQFPTQEICTLKPLSLACHRCQCTHSGWAMKAMQMGRAWRLKTAHVVEQFNHFVYVSEFSRKIIEPFLPASTPKTVLYNPVSAEQEPIAEPSRADVFSFIGRLSPEKGGTLLAAAARKAGVPCRFIGQGSEAESIRAANPDAEFTGWVTSDKVVELIRNSRAVVMPSLWYETAGLSVLEAVSRGVPVIVADRCASTEYMRHERSGLTFRTGEVESLAHALGSMTPERAKEYGINAYQDYWSNPLTIERYMNGLQDVYERTLSS